MAKRFDFSDLQIGHGVIISEGFAEIGHGCNIVEIYTIDGGIAEEIDTCFKGAALTALSSDYYLKEINGQFGEDLDADNRLTAFDLGVGHFGRAA